MTIWDTINSNSESLYKNMFCVSKSTDGYKYECNPVSIQ